MSSKLSLSLATALALSVAAARVSHAAPMDTTNAQIDAGESGNPDSLDYGNRTTPSQPATNDDINAAERDNPQSPDYANHPPPMTDGDTNADWQSSESADPDGI
jgi:hypothetical protein